MQQSVAFEDHFLSVGFLFFVDVILGISLFICGAGDLYSQKWPEKEHRKPKKIEMDLAVLFSSLQCRGAMWKWYS